MPDPRPEPDVTTDLPAAKAETDHREDTSLATGAYTPSEKNDDFEVSVPKPPAPEIPGYEVLGELGRGGMGVVYHARQIGLNRLVALKMILAGSHASPSVLARFLAEAQAVARFQHPGIVQVFEVGEHDGLPFFSLEYVDGGTLARKVSKEPQPPRYAATVAEQLARAMRYAHERGIIHRDLKPANILLAKDGTPKITDFGLAKEIEGESGVTQDGQVLGTPSYMAPEQARGETVGPLADVYALGAILYDLLTGRPPFSGSSILDTLDMVRTREPVPPSQLTAKLPRDLETICLKCLEKEPAKRYATAGDLADDLQRYLEGRPIVARPVSRAEKAWRWAKRNPVGAVAVFLAVALLVVPSILSWQLFVANGEANAARTKAEEERDLKEEARRAEEAAKLQAVAEEKRAKEARDVAAAQRKVALDTIRAVLIDIDNVMRNRTTLAPLRKRIIDQMLKKLDDVRDTALRNPLEDRTEGLAYGRIGGIYFLANQVTDAALWLNKADEVFRKLLRENETDEVYLLNMAIVTHDLGKVEERVGHTPRGRELHAEALKLRERRVAILETLVKEGKAKPADLIGAKQLVAESHGLVALADLRLGRPEKALESYRLAEEGFEALPTKDVFLIRVYRAETKMQMGHAFLRLGKLPEAEKAYLDGQALRAETLRRTPKTAAAFHAAAQFDLAQTWLYLGDFQLLSRGDAIAAIGEYERARPVFEAALAADPEQVDIRRRLSGSHYRLGVATFLRTDRSGILGLAENAIASRTHFETCLADREKVAAIDRRDVFTAAEALLVRARLGQIPEVEKGASELLKTPSLDLAARYQVACVYAVASSSARDPNTAKRLKTWCFDLLNDLAEAGWRGVGDLLTEPDLDSIRGDVEFEALLKRMK